MSVPAGSMCIGSGRRVPAVGQAGSGARRRSRGHPALPGPRLPERPLAVQAASQGTVTSLSNALAIQNCP